MIYPQAWVPGLGEIGSGYTQTWGNLYPRTGEIIQSHPVKASAVLAERVASIIYKEAQPHIYSRVQPSGAIATSTMARSANGRCCIRRLGPGASSSAKTTRSR
jgi:hypothetical protein